MGPGARGSLAPRGEEGAAGTQKEPIAAGGRVWGAGAGEGNTCPRCFPRKCRLRWPWLMLYPSVAARFIYLFIKPLFRNNSKLSLQKARLACSSLGNLPPNEGSRSPARYLPHALLERGA